MSRGIVPFALRLRPVLVARVAHATYNELKSHLIPWLTNYVFDSLCLGSSAPVRSLFCRL